MAGSIADALVGKTLTGFTIEEDREAITFVVAGGEPVQLYTNAD